MTGGVSRWRANKPLAVSARMAGVLLLAGLVAAPAPSQEALRNTHADQAKETAQASQIRQLGKLTLAENARILEHGQEAADHNARIPLSSEKLEAMPAFRVGEGSGGAYDEALTCLSQAVYYEAANEPVEGKRAVAQVVLNRVRHPAYPASVCGVVYEGWNKAVCQFSFTCDGSLRRTPMAAQWNSSRAVARAALAGHVEASVGSATHYHADYVLPRWAFTLGKVQTIGRHLFYRFPGSAGRAQSFSARWNGREHKPRIDLTSFEFAAEHKAAEDAEILRQPQLVRDPTDRRAENDVGGRMDPSKQWRLAIPDPVNASASYEASRQLQQPAQPLAMADDGANAGGELQ